MCVFVVVCAAIIIGSGCTDVPSRSPEIAAVSKTAPTPKPPVKSDTPAASWEVDGPADALLEHMARYYQDRQSFRFDLQLDVRFEERGQVQTVNLRQAVRFERPNRLALALIETEDGEAIYSDGKQLLRYWPMFAAYMTLAAPENFDRIHEVDAELQPNSLIDGFVDTLFATDGTEAVKRMVRSSTYLGTAEANGVECHHCRCKLGSLDTQAWIATGDTPRLIKFYTPSMTTNQGNKPAMTFHFNKWKFDLVLEDRDFQFAVPKSAAKVASVSEAYMQYMRRQQMEQIPAYQLVGKQAPAISIPVLGAGEFTLQEHKDKNIVVLEFWATWCGPCRVSLPRVARVAKQFEDQGVVFYAINMRDPPGKVGDFMSQQGLDVSVAMDHDGRVSTNYLAHSIPQTVVIGKDGTIEAMHVGFSANLENELQTELATLVRGKSLVKTGDGGPKTGD